MAAACAGFPDRADEGRGGLRISALIGVLPAARPPCTADFYPVAPVFRTTGGPRTRRSATRRGLQSLLSCRSLYECTANLTLPCPSGALESFVSQSVQADPVETLKAASAPLIGERGGGFGSVALLLVETSKPRITRLVTITSGVGFVMAALAGPWQPGVLLVALIAVLVGTAFSSAGANTLNQWMERKRDARMPRTAGRPLPQGRLGSSTAVMGGLATGGMGVLVLWIFCGIVPAAVALSTIFLYLLFYTPLKPVTPLATLVGAVPGALPPVIGWTAAAQAGGEGWSALLHPGAWLLFGIMFVWQIPHFLAIAWMYREDYAAGGYRVLPVIDPEGKRTSRAILRWSILLLPATVAPALLMTPPFAAVFAILAVGMGLTFMFLTWRLVHTLARSDARRAFLASLIHLPLLMAALVTLSILSTLLKT
jgi:heme o synthase